MPRPRLTVMGDRGGFVWKDRAHVGQDRRAGRRQMEALKIVPSGLCERRRVPPPRLAGPDRTAADGRRGPRVPGRRPRPRASSATRSIDRLIGSDAFIEHWTNKWADLLQVNRKARARKGPPPCASGFAARLPPTCPTTSSSTRSSRPRVRTVSTRRLPTSRCSATPGHDWRATTQLFLGVRFNCNKCHDHPFERWTQDQYYQTAAYFCPGRLQARSGLGQPQGGRYRRRRGANRCIEIVADIPQGEVHPRRTRWSGAQFPFPASDPRPAKARAARQFDRLATSPDNPYFARSYVNRAVGLLAGRGTDRAGGRHPRRQPAHQSRAARLRLTAEFVSRRLQRAAADPPDLQVADLPAVDRHQRLERRRRDQLLATPWPGGCRPRSCTTRSTGRPAPCRRFPACLPERGRLPCPIPVFACPTASSPTWAGRRGKVPASASGPAACSSGR